MALADCSAWLQLASGVTPTTNREDWRREIVSHDELFIRLYSQLPKELIFQRELLVSRL